MKPNAPADKPSAVSARVFPLAYKGALIAVVALAFAIPLALAALPFIEFFNGMAAQPKAKAQMHYGRVFGEELRAERLPVEGTVPRGYVAYEFAHVPGTLEEAAKVGDLLDNPLPRTLVSMQQGQTLFNVHCTVCHGKLGTGDGPVTGPNRFPAPPSLHTDQARGYQDGTIFHIITQGTAKMPTYADKLDPTERWQVVHYLRALQRAQNPKPEDLEP